MSIDMEEAIKKAGMLDLVIMKLNLKASIGQFPDAKEAKRILGLVEEELKIRDYKPLFPGGDPF